MAVGDGVSPLAALNVSFGGFSPTLLGELQSTKEQVLRLQEENARRRELFERQRELEFARTSDLMSFSDKRGTIWHYVIVDDVVVKIVGLNTEEAIVSIPPSINGRPVYSIGSDACSNNDIVEEIHCPDNIEVIETCAFRFCKNLKKVRFPACISNYDPTWLYHCPNIEEVVLPGLLETLDSSIFDNSGLKRLVIGKSARVINPGAFQKTRLEELTIDEGNPYIKTDGDAIYTIDGTILISIARPVRELEIQEGCTAIGKKAAYGIRELKKVIAPEGLGILGEFAFAHSGIEEFCAPKSLVEIQQKAFLSCDCLTSIELNEGLVVIGDSAFEQSGIGSLHIPPTIETVGSSITRGTNIVHCGPNRTFTIDEQSSKLFTDGEGGLYRIESDGVHLVQLIDDSLKSYSVFEGTRVVDDHAFAFNNTIEVVSIPEGVQVIGPSAFRVCSHLRKATISDTVREIGDEAFFDTNLETFRIPASLEQLGERALVTYGAHHGDQRPSLEEVSVAKGNDRFIVICGILCRRIGDELSAVVFTSSVPDVILPDNLVAIEDYAFNNARNIEFLSINRRLRSIGSSGFTTWCWIKHIHIEVDEPIEGRSQFDFYFPNTSKSLHGISLGIGGASWVHVPGLVAQYDICVVNAHDYTARGDYDSISVYEQVKLVLGRLKDPFLLTDVNRRVYDRLVRNHLSEMCVDVARHDDREAINGLIELGFLNESNIEQVIAEVGKLQDAAMTGYLLEVKRMRFNQSIIDFDL